MNEDETKAKHEEEQRRLVDAFWNEDNSEELRRAALKRLAGYEPLIDEARRAMVVTSLGLDHPDANVDTTWDVTAKDIAEGRTPP